MSARLSSAAGSVACAGASARPSEPPISTSRPSRDTGCSSERSSRRPTRTARSSSSVPLEQDGELVAAEAGDEAARPDRRPQPGADLDQQQVAVLVAEGVVDVLEPVEVEDHDRGAAGAAVGDLVERGRQLALQRGAVGQAGQRVVQRLVPQLVHAARRSAARRWRGWPPSRAAARRRRSKLRTSPSRSVTTSTPRTPAPPRSGTATASRAPCASSQRRSSASRVPRGISSGSPSPTTRESSHWSCRRRRLPRTRPSRPIGAEPDVRDVAAVGRDEGDLGPLGVQQLPGLPRARCGGSRRPRASC